MHAKCSAALKRLTGEESETDACQASHVDSQSNLQEARNGRCRCWVG